MNKMFLTAILATSLLNVTAFAQTTATGATTESTTATTTAMDAQQTAVPQQKKKKTKKSKKSAKAEATRTSASVKATEEAIKPITKDGVIIERPAAATTATDAATTVAPANAAATSTASVEAQANAKKWGVSASTDSAMAIRGLTESRGNAIDTVSYVSASYKVADNAKVAFRQYFEQHLNSKDEGATNEIKASWPVLTLSSKVGKVLGSDDIAGTFWYYMPSNTAEKNSFGKNLENFYGMLRADLPITWTINPKWSFTWYLNPRQSVGADDKAANFEATTRLIQYPIISYNITDTMDIYYYAGHDSRMATSRFTSTKDDFTSGLGMDFTFLDGKFVLNTEINTTKTLKNKGQSQADQRLYMNDDISLEVVTVISL